MREKRVLVKMNRRKLVLSISMAMLLVGLFALIYVDKESKIKDFPVPMSAIHINDDNEEDYQYISVMPITKANGWENLGELLVLKRGKEGSSSTLSGRNYVLFI